MFLLNILVTIFSNSFSLSVNTILLSPLLSKLTIVNYHFFLGCFISATPWFFLYLSLQEDSLMLLLYLILFMYNRHSPHFRNTLFHGIIVYLVKILHFTIIYLNPRIIGNILILEIANLSRYFLFAAPESFPNSYLFSVHLRPLLH